MLHLSVVCHVLPRCHGHRKAVGKPEGDGARNDRGQADHHDGLPPDLVRDLAPNVGGQEAPKGERARDVARVEPCKHFFVFCPQK